MAFTTTFSTKAFNAKPPDKGSFPLDHEGDCRLHMMQFMKCLQKNNMENNLCREESKSYLQCRMDRNLMAKEDWSKLGFHDRAKSTQDKTEPNT